MTTVGCPSSKPIVIDDPKEEGIDLSSVVKLCPRSEHVVIYGWSHCKYLEFANCLGTIAKEAHAPVVSRWSPPKKWQAKDFPIQRVYTCGALGNFAAPQSEGNTTLEGRQMNLIRYCSDEENARLQASLNKSRSDKKVEEDQNRFFSHVCKAGITNAVVENVKRIAEGRGVIPVVFLVDIDGNPWPSNPGSVTSRDGRVTNKEMRRAWKLCFDPEIDPRIREAARKTFTFVKMKKTMSRDGKPISGGYSLEPIDPFWGRDGKNSAWAMAWQRRTATPSLKKKDLGYSWRLQVNKAVSDFFIKHSSFH